MLRNTAQAALRGFGTWWMDLPAQGWFNDAAHLGGEGPPAAGRAGDAQARPALHAGDRGDSGRGQHVSSDGRLERCRETADLRRPGRLGAAAARLTGSSRWRTCWRAKCPRNCRSSSPPGPCARRTVVPSRTSRPPNTTRVWCYAPGYLLPDRADIAAMTEVTGFKHRAVSPSSAEATPTEAGRKDGPDGTVGAERSHSTLVRGRGDPAETLATYNDGSPAVAVRRSPRGLDIFVGVPALTPELGARVRPDGGRASVHGRKRRRLGRRGISFDSGAQYWSARDSNR